MYDGPESPNEGACFRYMMKPESPNEGACLRHRISESIRKLTDFFVSRLDVRHAAYQAQNPPLPTVFANSYWYDHLPESVEGSGVLAGQVRLSLSYVIYIAQTDNMSRAPWPGIYAARRVYRLVENA